MKIHPTAVIAPSAEVAGDVEIGPYAVIQGPVKIGQGCKIGPHATIMGNTTLGRSCRVHALAVIGNIPQDLKYHGEESRLEIGPHTVIREHVTINPGTEGGGLVTRVGAHCLLMVGAHVAHDCQLGDHVILVNNATLGGHVAVGDHAILGGLCAVHQFVRIGAHGFVGGMSGVEKDVIPFGMVIGNRAHLSGLNVVGLKRHGFPREQIHELRQAYRMLFASEGTLKERLEDVDKMFPANPLVRQIVDFISSHSDRSFCVPNNNVSVSSQD